MTFDSRQLPLVKTTNLDVEKMRTQRQQLQEDMEGLIDDRKRQTAAYNREKKALQTDIDVLTSQILTHENYWDKGESDETL